jgi:site-specific DNA recombinase
MEYNPRVQIIPAKPKPRDKQVAIYARVSSNSVEQLNSLTSQISGLIRLTTANPTWLLVDTYIDIASSKTGSHRKEFNRLLSDCTANKVDIVITKNVSRFGRDSLEILSALEQLRETNTRVIFETEEIDTDKTDSRLMISIIESFAQAENESRSDNIKWATNNVLLMVHQSFTIESAMATPMMTMEN